MSESRFRSAALAIAWRNAAQLLHEPGAADAGPALPAVLLHGVRGRALARERRARLRLPGRLHGLPVRVRAAAGLGVRGRVHRLRHGARLRAGLRPAPDARRHAAGGHPGRVSARRRGEGPDHRHAAVRDRGGHRNGGARRRRGPVRPHWPRAARELRRRALGGGHRAALPLAAGGPAHADARVPRALPRAGVCAAGPAAGLDRDGGERQPVDRDGGGNAQPARREAGGDRPGIRGRSGDGRWSSGSGHCAGCAAPRRPAASWPRERAPPPAGSARCAAPPAGTP